MERSEPGSGAVAGAVAWAGIGALACAAMTPLEPSLLEEGMLIQVATRLVDGERLFVDVASFTGPLPFEALALLFRVFGEEIAVARAAVAVLHGAACGALFALARSARAGALAHVAPALLAAAPVFCFPLLSIYYYSTLAGSLAVLAALAAWGGSRRSGSAGWAVVAGALVAGVALSKQTVGVALAAALGTALLACAPSGRRLASGLAFAAGGAAVAVLTLAAYAVQGTLGAVVESLVWLPLSFDETFSSTYVNFWPPGVFSHEVRRDQAYYVPFLYSLFHGVMLEPSRAVVVATQLLYALPFAALAAAPLARLLRPLPAAVWMHAALHAALLSHLFPRTDWGHLVFVLPASAVQLVLVAGALRPPRRVAAAAGALGVAGLAAAALYWAAVLHLSAGDATWGPRVPLRPVSHAYQSDAVPRVIRYLGERTRPGEPIFVPRAEPLLYFATDTTNPTPYSGVVPGQRELQQRVILEALEGVRFVVMSELDQPIYTYYRDELPEVQRYLERHFQVPPPFRDVERTWLVVLERGPDGGDVALDLIHAAREAGRPFVRDREGAEKPPSYPTPELASRLNRRPLLARLGPRGGGVDVDLTLPPGARLEFDWGLASLRGARRRWEHPEQGRLEVAVRMPGQASFETLLSEPLAARDPEGAWRTVAVDLSRWAGHTVTLRLQAVTDASLPPRQRLFWWGSPRVVVPETNERSSQGAGAASGLP